MKLSTIVENTYTFFTASEILERNLEIEEERLTKSIVDVSNFKVKNVTKKILNLPVNEQIHVLHKLIDLYDYNNPKLIKLLRKKDFKKYIALLGFLEESDYLTDDELAKKIAKFEKVLGVKIVFDSDVISDDVISEETVENKPCFQTVELGIVEEVEEEVVEEVVEEENFDFLKSIFDNLLNKTLLAKGGTDNFYIDGNQRKWSIFVEKRDKLFSEIPDLKNERYNKVVKEFTQKSLNIALHNTVKEYGLSWIKSVDRDEHKLILMKELIALGADINYKIYDFRPILFDFCPVISHSSYELMEFFINAGADVNAKDNDSSLISTVVYGGVPKFVKLVANSKKVDQKELDKALLDISQPLKVRERNLTVSDKDAINYNSRMNEMIDILINAGAKFTLDFYNNSNKIRKEYLKTKYPAEYLKLNIK